MPFGFGEQSPAADRPPPRSLVRLLVLTVPVILVLALSRCDTSSPDATVVVSTDMNRPVLVSLESRGGEDGPTQLISGRCAGFVGELPEQGQPVNPDLYQFFVIVDAESGEEILRLDMVTDPVYQGHKYVWDGETLADLRGEDPGPIWTRPGPDPCEYGDPKPDATTPVAPVTPGSSPRAPTPQSRTSP